MDSEQAMGRQDQGPTGPLPAEAGGAGWPRWRGDEPVTAPDGHPYLLAAVRMTVPAGRMWQRHRLVENEQLHTRLVPLLGSLPLSHSLLQEPHGGLPCRFHDRTLALWQDPDPGHWPNTLYHLYTEQDGPRLGIGEVTVTLRLETRTGELHQHRRTVSECNVRADARLILTQLPHHHLPRP
ncbi:hypothetical protein [Streptomyces sp. NPDC002187]|uniref:hypothetical protein n=1 Tax=Streptomyces sp. NPDC002187 TaxID=3364637 RepID=UPI003679070B